MLFRKHILSSGKKLLPDYLEYSGNSNQVSLPENISNHLFFTRFRIWIPFARFIQWLGKNLRLYFLGLILMVPPLAGVTQDSLHKFTFHFQLTTVFQGHPAFRAAYSGMNSLRDSAETALSLTTTLFLGRRLWKGASFYFNPEVAGGTGMSNTLGIAGFTNGETFRIGNPQPQGYIARAFIRQHISLGQDSEKRTGEGVNQVNEVLPLPRLDITLGKLALSDIFDDNSVSHDPRTDFLNWSLMNNGAWDYAANTRGYTYLIAFELIHRSWALRYAEALEPTYANGPDINFQLLKTQSENLELDKNMLIGNEPGNIRLLGYLNNTRGASYLSLIRGKLNGTDTGMDVIYGTAYGNLKYGFGLNMDQQLNRQISVFMRAGWDNGKTATWAFANIDQTISGGIRITGTYWDRQNDHVGIAGVSNGISPGHRAFLNAGGYDFMIGDGKLTHYGQEDILEIYYQALFLRSLFITADYQFVDHPAYNLDRGPVHVISLRTHVEF